MNDFQCNEALPLIAAYIDGELSEAQAAPLRRHLLSCHGCRNSAQAVKASSRWFQRADADDLVPAGFAAHVARRAFAGDTGERDALTSRGATVTAAASPRRHVSFLVEVTGVAAAVLVAFSVAFRMREVPSGEVLRADDALSVEEIKDRLDELNVIDRSEEAVADLSADPALQPGGNRDE